MMFKRIKTHFAYAKQHPVSTFFYLFIILVLCIFISRYLDERALKKRTLYDAVPNVNAVIAKATAEEEKIYLPGSALAWHEAPIYARTKGYLKEWYVDIGWKVKKGDLLAVIERPELDAQYYEAKAYLKMITAQNDLAQITARRWNHLVQTDSVSKQANDDKTYEAASLLAEKVKAQANLEYLSALVSFERVVAPFDGTISLRQTDIGALINIGSDPSEAQPLFRIVQLNRLRLYVNIPQMYISRLTPNMHVTMRFAEHPGAVFPAKLLKTANAIDPVTLTLQAEFEVQNEREILLPGSYTMVEFTLKRYSDSVMLPINTLIFQAQGLQVAVLNKNNCLDIRDVTVGTDYGSTVQINSGLKVGERVVINPYDFLHQGECVHVVS